MSLQIRRGIKAEADTLAQPPQEGELIWITDDAKLYIGDGATLLRDLDPVTGFNAEDAADTIGEILQTTSTHQGISFAYNDIAKTINATVSLDQLRQNVDMNGQDITGAGNINITGNVTATRFVGDYQGSVSADDSTILVDGVNGKINLNGTVNTDIIPDAQEAYDIGSPTNRFKDLYLSGSSLWLGMSQITRNASGGINLPAGSTVDGGPIGGGGAGQSLNVDIVSDDSSVIVNSSNGNITANQITGDLTGSVFGDDSAVLVNGVDSTVKLDNGTTFIDGNIVKVDDTNLYIGEQTDVTSTTVSITNTDGSAAIDSVRLSAPNNPSIIFTSYHGSFATPTQPSAGDPIGGFSSRVYDPVKGGNVSSSLILFDVDNNKTPSTDFAPGKIEFINNAGTGASPTLKYATFDSDGQFAINQQNAQATLDVNGLARLVPQTSAPTGPVSGTFAVADGNSWDPSSKGAVIYPVFYDGSSWVALY